MSPMTLVVLLVILVQARRLRQIHDRIVRVNAKLGTLCDVIGMSNLDFFRPRKVLGALQIMQMFDRLESRIDRVVAHERIRHARRIGEERPDGSVAE